MDGDIKKEIQDFQELWGGSLCDYMDDGTFRKIELLSHDITALAICHYNCESP